MAHRAEELLAAALNEASAQSSDAAREAVAELRHIHGIADKLLAGLEAVRAGQEAATEKLLAGQAALAQQLLAGQEAMRVAAAEEARVARLQRARALFRSGTYEQAADWVLGCLIGGQTEMILSKSHIDYYTMNNITGDPERFVAYLASITGLRFRLAKDAQGHWSLQESNV